MTRAIPLPDLLVMGRALLMFLYCALGPWRIAEAPGRIIELEVLRLNGKGNVQLSSWEIVGQSGSSTLANHNKMTIHMHNTSQPFSILSTIASK